MQWISVNERLPDLYGDYLVAFWIDNGDKDDDDLVVSVAEFWHTGEWGEIYGVEIEVETKILYWMPYPKPPPQ